MKENISLEDLNQKMAEVTEEFDGLKAESIRLESEVTARKKRLVEIHSAMIQLQGQYKAIEALIGLVQKPSTTGTDVQS